MAAVAGGVGGPLGAGRAAAAANSAGESGPPSEHASAGSAGDLALMAKTMEAFRFSALAYLGPAAGVAMGERAAIAQGRQAALGQACGCAMVLRWRADTRSLVIACRGSHRLFNAIVAGPPDSACPRFLERLQPEARVHSALMQVFEDFVATPEDPGSLPGALRVLLAGAHPRSCTGYCVGGAVVTIVAAWAALRWPAADVRCIVFGAPRVGNASFAEASPLLCCMPRLAMHGCATPAQALGAYASLHACWQDHELRAYLSTLVRLVNEHACELAPPTNALGQRQLVDPGVVAAEEDLRAASQSRTACRGQAAAAAPSSPGQEARHGGSGAGKPPSAGRDGAVPRAAASPAAAAEGVPGARPAGVALGRASSASAAMPATGWGPSLGASIRRALRRAVSCQPGEHEEAEQCAASPDPPWYIPAAGMALRSGPAEAPGVGPLPHPEQGPERWQAVQAMWGELKCGVEEMSRVQESIWREGTGYVGDAEADRLVEAWAAGNMLEQLSLQRGSAPEPTGPAAADAGSRPHGAQPRAAADEAAASALRHAAPLCPADSSGQADEAEAAAGQGRKEPPLGSDDEPPIVGVPPALQLLVARRLRLPLQLSLAAYHDSGGFRSATGIKRSVLVEDRAFDAQARAKAHLGFLQQCLAVTSTANPDCNLGCALARLSGGAAPTRVICAGHSLGGAVATLVSVWAALQWPAADVRCFSFGSPKVGNSKFVRAYQTLVGMRVRVVNGADPVPNLPPDWALPRLRYRHVWPACHLHGSELVLSLKSLRLFPSIKDHQLLQYAKALASAARVSMEADSVKLEMED
eukprot:scaffold6.g2580.t1